jgi:hypothetical protein
MGQFMYPAPNAGYQYMQMQPLDGNAMANMQFAPVFPQGGNYMMPCNNIPPTNYSEVSHNTFKPEHKIPVSSEEEDGILVPEKPKKRWKREDDKRLFAFLRKH